LVVFWLASNGEDEVDKRDGVFRGREVNGLDNVDVGLITALLQCWTRLTYDGGARPQGPSASPEWKRSASRVLDH
jgi:hypothetical protein